MTALLRLAPSAGPLLWRPQRTVPPRAVPRPGPAGAPPGPPTGSGRAAAVGWVLAGVVLMGLSPLVVAVAGAPASTAAFGRCALASLVLVPLAVAESRRRGVMPPRAALVAGAAGAFLGADFVLFAHSILTVGASIATVLVTVQVVVSPMLSRGLRGSPIPGRYWVAVPVVMLGIALVAGVQDVAVAPDPLGVLLGLGAGVAYGCYLFLLRESSGSGPRLVVAPVAYATLGATGSAGLLGVLTGGLDLAQSPRTWAWLVALALGGQVLAWLAVHRGAQLLPPATVASLLVGQPVLSVLAGVVLLGEQLSLWQAVGGALTVAAVTVVTVPGRSSARGRSAGAPPPEEREGSPAPAGR